MNFLYVTYCKCIYTFNEILLFCSKENNIFRQILINTKVYCIHVVGNDLRNKMVK